MTITGHLMLTSPPLKHQDYPKSVSISPHFLVREPVARVVSG